MSSRKKTPGTAIAKRTAEHRNLPMRKGGADAAVERAIIPHDTWVTGTLIDSSLGAHEDGTETCEFTWTVTNPRLYAGQQLRFVMSEKLNLSLDSSDPKSLASKFEGVNLLDPDDVWEKLGGLAFRIHVGHREYLDVESGETKRGYRVSGFALDERSRV